VKVGIILRTGQRRDLLGVDNADDWVRSFGVRGTSLLGDWLEVVPDEGEGRTFVRASEVVTVQLIDDDEGGPHEADAT
jgi:hypothetical protein